MPRCVAFVATPSPRSLPLACSAPVAAPAASTGAALGLRGPAASGRHRDAPVRSSQGRVSQAESALSASPRASWFVLAHKPRHSLSRRLLLGLSASSRAARARLSQARRDCQAPGDRGGRSDPRKAGGLARVSGSPVSGAPLGCQPEPGRAPMPGYPLESHARRGPSPPLRLIVDGSEEARAGGGDGRWAMGNLGGSRLVEGSKYRARLNFFARPPGWTRARLVVARKN